MTVEHRHTGRFMSCSREEALKAGWACKIKTGPRSDSLANRRSTKQQLQKLLLSNLDRNPSSQAQAKMWGFKARNRANHSKTTGISAAVHKNPVARWASRVTQRKDPPRGHESHVLPSHLVNLWTVEGPLEEIEYKTAQGHNKIPIYRV